MDQWIILFHIRPNRLTSQLSILCWIHQIDMRCLTMDPEVLHNVTDSNLMSYLKACSSTNETSLAVNLPLLLQCIRYSVEVTRSPILTERGSKTVGNHSTLDRWCYTKCRILLVSSKIRGRWALNLMTTPISQWTQGRIC